MFEPVGNKAFLLDPAAVLEEMRTQHPVYRYEKSAVPIVNIFGYHDIRAVLRDVERFSNTLTGAQQDKAATDPYNLLGMDPPRHRDMREVVKSVFTPGMVRSLEPVIRTHANQIMDTVLEMGEFDAVEDFGAQLSVHLICQLIGVPEDEKPLIREWTREASELGFDLLWHEHTNPDYERRIATSMQTMHDYFAEKIDDRLRHPGSDVLTQIARSGLSREESVSFARLLLVAGNETTTNLINHILRLLVLHPEQQAELRRQPELAAGTMAETLRYAPAIRGTFREAREST
jgi:cytochrome P450